MQGTLGDILLSPVAANTRLTAENTEETRALARMFDGHLEAAEAAEQRVQAEVDRIWAALTEKRDHDHDDPHTLPGAGPEDDPGPMEG